MRLHLLPHAFPLSFQRTFPNVVPHAVFCSVIVAALSVVAPAWALDGKSGYKLGDRLAPAVPSTPPTPSKTPPAKAPAAPAQAVYREIDWDALLPRDWDPAKAFKGLNLGRLNDADPRAMQALEKLKEMWEHAPTTPALNGVRVRIPGFIVPLERTRDAISEFLLVPYFGACIHTPPPPANQIIHVFPAKMLKNGTAMEPVWVSGVLEAARSGTSMGSAGYRLNADLVEPYKKKP